MNSKITILLKFTLLLFFTFSFQFLQAQVPQKMSYQAVIRNSNNVLVVSSPIGIRISILQNSETGGSVYSETQNTTTNNNGLVSLQIGSGTVISGLFSTINWGSGNYYIKTETDPTGGNNYSIIGSSQLLSVPYALYSANGPQGIPGTFPQGTNVGDMQYWNGTSWVMIPIGQPGQTLKVTNTSIPQWSQSTLSTVTTDSVLDIFALNATFTGTVTNAGTELVLSRGFCYSTTPTPTVSNSIITSFGGLGIFQETANDLLPNTTYYVRAFSTTIAGTTYGIQLTFTTLNGLANVTTTPATAISGCQAISGGTIITDGGSSIISYGVCFGTNPNPTILDDNTSGDGNIPFGATLTTTSSNTLFYYRAYVTNGVGTFYGNQFSFTSENITTNVTTQSATLIKSCSATLNGTVTSSNLAAIQSQGICYGTTSNPSAGIDASVSLNSEIGGLLPNTLYYARAYATTCALTTYGNQVSFTTANNLLTVTTLAATNITNCSATLNATASTNPEVILDSNGFVYSTTSNPSIENGGINIACDVSNFTTNLSCLASGTYYVKAYANNCFGRIYGNEISFTILPNTISVITNNATVVRACSVIFENITINNNLSDSCINAKGICVSTNSNPTILNILSSLDSNNLTYNIYYYLLPQTTYYYRSYATLCNGTTVYGNQLSFITLPKITTVTTNPVTNITSGTAVLNGLIIGNTQDYVESGIFYGINPNPTSSEKNSYYAGANAINLSITINNLKANTTYYARSWVKGYNDNSCIDLMYGNQVTFTTSASPHVVGENFDGGIIVWLNNTNTSGLIAATTNQDNASWGCEGTSIVGTNTTQGSGQANTNSILSSCTTSNIAAKICNDLVLNGKSDWYLPSEADLILVGNLNFFPSGNYWSSTQFNATQARFVNGTSAGSFNKSQTNFKVRAMRSF